jgi:hypothetical protein
MGEDRPLRKLLLALVLGIVLGSSAVAFAAGVFGSGTLNGWTVTKDGEEVCSDPDVDTNSKEIECN